MSQQPRKLGNLQIEMKEELFTNLPTEIVIDIVLRLPIRSIITCKFVCKSWRDLVDSLEFAHLYKAVPHLVLFLGMDRSIPNKMVEFVDEHCSANRCNIVSNLSFPHPGVIFGSVNGLIFWCSAWKWSRDLFVCNPITREYIKIPPPPQFEIFHLITVGVGVSKMGGQYKIVRILQVYNKHNSQLDQCECQLHTLGTGSWRSFSVGTQLVSFSGGTQLSVGAFLNGNLHWLAFDCSISCFDLETELFTSFSSPLGLEDRFYKTLSVVGDRLCLCYSTIRHKIVIWFMSEYGDEKSWTKEFIIREDCRGLYGWLFPIKVFINGDILIAREQSSEIFCYSKTTDVIHNTGIHKASNVLLSTSAVIYTPTFLPLRALLMVTENVISSF